MTPLMMLALTVPPSIAWFVVRLVDLYIAEELKLSAKQVERLETLEKRVAAVDELVGWHARHEDVFKVHETRINVHEDTLSLMRQELNAGAQRFHEQDAELKRLNEQLTTLQERVYRQ